MALLHAIMLLGMVHYGIAACHYVTQNVHYCIVWHHGKPNEHALATHITLAYLVDFPSSETVEPSQLPTPAASVHRIA